MSNNQDKRLIEDYLPIVAISAEASREKSVRKGHISTLHLWWARRPLVACRAAVYGALVPASRFVPNNGSDAQKKSLGRANAAKFVERLCQYPGSPAVIAEAQRHILEAHAERLTQELCSSRREEAQTSLNSQPSTLNPNSQSLVTSAATPAWVKEFKFTGDTVTVEDIVAGKAPRPKVLDMFAGGGAIPLEALRLGCEAYALDLNPVAHIIELCTLVYPQKYGKPDPTARGMTGPKNAKGETTWGGLADEVRYWGNWVLEKVRAEIGDLYPLIPDPEFHGHKKAQKGATPTVFEPPQKTMAFAADAQMTFKAGSQSAICNPQSEIPPGYLMPVAYLWTRTVTCKNPNCKATVPLLKQTWLCKKDKRYVALKMIAPRGKKQVHFEVVEARAETGLGFDPEAFSKGGNATCPFCGTVADSDYVKAEGCAGRMGEQIMSLVYIRPGQSGKVYIPPDDFPEAVPNLTEIQKRTDRVAKAHGFGGPDEPMPPRGTLGFRVQAYGITNWGQVFSPRQTLMLLTFVEKIQSAFKAMRESCYNENHSLSVTAILSLAFDRVAAFSSRQCTWNFTGGRGVKYTFQMHILPMVWDYAEGFPFNPEGASWASAIEDLTAAVEQSYVSLSAIVFRGSAHSVPIADQLLDAVVTDPPYYDNVPYADLSDFFYVWLKRLIGRFYPEHFSSSLTPKKQEAIAEPVRHRGQIKEAKKFYEQSMAQAFAEAERCLKPHGTLVVVYAHKTTLGWATLVDALRMAGFMISEAWPFDTERPGRLRAQDSAALAASIFLVARKREGAETGNFDVVKPELEQIVRERVETLWAMGISGADLVIACVGAGLRAFTRFARVEYANGEEVPAERFLTEVETVVLESILGRLSKEVGGKTSSTTLAGLDPASRFYILWRYTYGAAELDAGEAIIFANGTHVELEGHNGLASGSNAVLEKNKSKYRLLDFTARGDEPKLGLPSDNGNSAPLVDTLHRLLWLLEHKPPKIPEFLADAQPNLEQLRLVCQALAGPALKGLPAALRSAQAGGVLPNVSTSAEQSTLGKLLANWSAVMEGQQVKADKRVGQERFL